MPTNYTSLDENDMQIILVPLDDYEIDEEYLNVSWTVTGFNSEYMDIKLNFTDPLQISVRSPS